MLDLSQNIVIRPSSDADVPAMLAIYQHHITRGVEDLGDYEPDTLNAEDLKRRRKTMRRRRLPHLVADLNGMVAGYAYAVPFRKRPAYRYTLKHSIYVHPGHLHAGIGRRLLPTLIEACTAAGYRQLIGYIDGANEASLRLHEFLRLPPGRAPARGRLQIRPLERQRHDAARPRRGGHDQARRLGPSVRRRFCPRGRGEVAASPNFSSATN